LPVSPTSQQEFSDADWRVVATGDQSKKAKFELSNLTTATTRVITMPDADLTLWGSVSPTFTGTLTGPVLRLTDTTDASLSSTGHALQIGATSGPNFIFDTNEAMTRNNGAAATMFLNAEGGNVTIGDATTLLTVTGGQIAFPATQVPSSDANTLDDYEEGTWTPVLSFGGGSTGITYSAQSGTYTKIGNGVLARVGVTLSNKGSSTGVPSIAGLPFASGSSGSVFFQTTSGTFSSLVAGLAGFTSAGGTTISIRMPNTTGNTSPSDTNFSNTSGMNAYFSYSL
jgi:hypothetical protein